MPGTQHACQELHLLLLLWEGCCRNGQGQGAVYGAVQAQGTSGEAVPSSFGEFVVRNMQGALHARPRSPREWGGEPRVVDGLKLQGQNNGLGAPDEEARWVDAGVGEPGLGRLGAE